MTSSCCNDPVLQWYFVFYFVWHFVLLSEFKECFSLFDGDSDGMVTEKELGLIMRSLGENITHFEIEEFMKKAGKGNENNTFEWINVVLSLIRTNLTPLSYLMD